MKNTTIPTLPRVTQEEYNSMTENEKRVYLLQIKQEDTMKWQKIVAQFQSYMILIGIAVSLFLVGVYINDTMSKDEVKTETISHYDTHVEIDSITHELFVKRSNLKVWVP